MRLLSRPTALALTAAAATVAAGCGSSSDDTTSTASSAPPAAATTTAKTTPTAAKDLTVTAKNFSFGPSTLDAKAGKVKITLDNQGPSEHELVLLKTSASPGSLKSSNGRVSESDSVGEIGDIAAGKTSSHTFDLKPGRYVFVCNVPGHYMAGMHGELVVR